MTLFEDKSSGTYDLVVERIVFQNPESGWTVARARLENGGQVVTVVGRLFGVANGERLRATAAWVHDRKYGKQLNISSYVTLDPASLRGLERYLGSGLLPGVGKVMARRLVEHFGQETLEILDEAPGRVREVPGIGPTRARKIADAWRSQRQARDTMIFLQGHEISAGLAARVVKRFGSDSITVVKQNPYRLAEEITGIGFAAADRVARSLGWGSQAPERVGGGILYTLRQAAANEGHLFLPLEELEGRATEILGVDFEAIKNVLPQLRTRRAVVVEEGGNSELRVYLPELFAAENEIAVHLRRLLARATGGPPIASERALRWFEQRSRLQLAHSQREAIKRALGEKVLILTGGPGTGKTTLVRAIVEILARKGLEIALAAPTGRAANRLGEATGRHVKTIHRLLEFDPHSLRFRRSPERPLEADLVVVDESSMIDAPLAQALFSSIPDDARLLIVGDADQLPSVGPGRVLSDLIASHKIPVVRLTEIFRQQEADGIVFNAHRIHGGKRPQPDTDDRGNFFVVQRSEPEEILGLVLDFVTHRVPEKFGLDPTRDIQVLSPMRRGALGTEMLNERLRGLLNPGSRGSDLLGRWRAGDRIMQTRNNYDLDVFNGDIGFVTTVDVDQRRLLVDFDGRTVVFQGAALEDLTLAYACTVHKAQGSEYPCVILPFHTQHFMMLQRNLLYTAVTRAQRLMIIVGDPKAIDIALGNRRQMNRFTALAGRIGSA